VLAPDLPGHGADPTPPCERPWERYAPSIAALVAEQAAPVILAGHSSGGMVISEAARLRPGRIAALVYLAAFLLPVGMTPRDVIGAASGSLLMESLVVDTAAGVMTVRPDMVREVFYHDCDDADAAWAIARLRPEPLLPPGREADGGRDLIDEPTIPRFYIETTLDQALPLAVQRRMYRDTPCRQIFSMDTGHSPFLSAPRQLATNLDTVAASYDSPLR
jgi:pimeloyl-ACP methyl ester carboxylesterase